MTLTLYTCIGKVPADHILWFGNTQDLCRGYVEHIGGGIGRIVTGEVPTGDDGNIIGFEEVVVDCHKFDIGVDRAEGVAAFCGGAHFVEQTATRNAGGAGELKETGILQETVAEGFIFVTQSGGIVHGNDLVFAESEGCILHIVQLLEDDGGADEQDDGDGELYDDKGFSEGNATTAGFEQSFQHF